MEANAIRAQVTSRTKTVRSFEGKLRRFAKRHDKLMGTVDDVFRQIGDLSGVRVATYGPEDEARVAHEIEKVFQGHDGQPIDIDLKDKLDPKGSQFYRATHCQAYLRDTDLVGDYENLKGASCEIQVCSMMAHVWNEIEHDIGYKPEGGGPDTAEKGLLETLGHITRSGDAAITRLLAANDARLQAQTGDFVNVFDFVARMQQILPGSDLSQNSGAVFEEAQLLGLNSPEQVMDAVGKGKFKLEHAKELIDAFNNYLLAGDGPEYQLTPNSADVVLALLLEKFAAKIEQNHPAGRGMGRPARIRSIAHRYLKFANGVPAEPPRPVPLREKSAVPEDIEIIEGVIDNV